jgi:hypothetical protein
MLLPAPETTAKRAGGVYVRHSAPNVAPVRSRLRLQGMAVPCSGWNRTGAASCAESFGIWGVRDDTLGSGARLNNS